MQHGRLSVQEIGSLLTAAFKPLDPWEPYFPELAALGSVDVTSPLTMPEGEFAAKLVELRRPLLARAMALTLNREAAADLVQETYLKALKSRHLFQAGTNMKAWTGRIMTNLFLSARRRDKFSAAWDDSFADRFLVAGPAQERALELSDVQRALTALPRAQREAFLRVLEQGESYEQAAAGCAVAVGTIKSRVSRARKAIGDMIDGRTAMPERAPRHATIVRISP